MKRTLLAGLLFSLITTACGTLEVGLEGTSTSEVTFTPAASTQTVLPPPPTVAVPADAVPYHNPELGFSLMLPAGWGVYGPEATQQGFSFYTLGPQVSGSGGPEISQIIVADATTTPEQFLQSYCSICPWQPFEAVLMDGVAGQRTTLGGETTPATPWTFFVHGGKLLGFSLRTLGEQNFDWVLSTLAFETPLGSTATPTPAPSAEATCPVTYVSDSKLYCLDAAGNPSLIADHSAEEGIVSDPVLSHDGAWVAYLMNKLDGSSQLWGVNVSTLGQDNGLDLPRTLLVSEVQLAPTDAERAHWPLRPQWQPGTHNLLFSTRYKIRQGEQGPGEYLVGDLWQVNADTGGLINLLPAEGLTSFALAPDGQMLALTTANAVVLAEASGAGVRNVIEFPFISTMSESVYKPEIVWSPDSTFFSVAIPSPDPLASDAHVDLYRVSRAGEAQKTLTLNGNFVFGLQPPLHISPDGAYAVYGKADPNTLADELHLVTLQTQQNEVLVEGPVTGLGWSPDSQHYAYNLNDMGNVLGVAEPNQVFGVPEAVPSGVAWVNATSFYFIGRLNGNGPANLFFQTLGAPVQTLVSELDTFAQVDVKR